MRWASALVLFASTLAVDGGRVRWLLPGVHDNEIDGLMFGGNAVAGAGSLARRRWSDPGSIPGALLSDAYAGRLC